MNLKKNAFPLNHRKFTYIFHIYSHLCLEIVDFIGESSRRKCENEAAWIRGNKIESERKRHPIERYPLWERDEHISNYTLDVPPKTRPSGKVAAWSFKTFSFSLFHSIWLFEQRHVVNAYVQYFTTNKWQLKNFHNSSKIVKSWKYANEYHRFSFNAIYPKLNMYPVNSRSFLPSFIGES